jgi:hypothetical protein
MKNHLVVLSCVLLLAALQFGLDLGITATVLHF